MDKSEWKNLPCPFCREKERLEVVLVGGVYNYLAVQCRVCNAIGPHTLSRVDAWEKWNTQAELVTLVEVAHEEGALAMAHYYHGEYASEQFKMDHADRALRPEHIEWAKKALAHARAILGGGEHV